MNPLLYPHIRESKPGLNKTRRIIKCNSDVQERDLRKSIPDSWIYNDSEAERIWEDLEKYDPSGVTEERNQSQNPFEKIDESAQRIRHMIDRFEMSDQDFLMTLMDILGDDELCASDQSDMLLEARFRLAQLIEDHAGNSDAQGKMLDSLKFWFHNIIQDSQDNISQGVYELMQGNISFDAAALANMINHSFEMREMSTEQIEELHRSVVDELTKKMRGMGKVVKEQQILIDDLQKIVDGYSSKRKQQEKKEKMLDSARKRLFEQEGAIVNLKKAITGLKEDLDTARSMATERSTAAPTARSDATEPLEVEIQCDQKVAALEDTINKMRMEISGHLVTIRKQKQNEALLEDKIQSLERQKKNMEQSLLNANEKTKMVESNYKKQIEEIEDAAKEKASTEMASQTKLFYEQQMRDLKEQERQRMNALRDDLDKRYRAQIDKIMRAIQDKDQSKLLTELNNRGAQELEAAKEQYLKQIKDLQDSSGHRITTLTKHYERKNRALLDGQQRIEASMERSINQATKTEKMALEEQYSQQLVKFQDKAASDLAELREKFSAKYEKMAARIQVLEREREAIKTVLEAADLGTDLFESSENEEEEENDTVLSDSLLQLKQREIEQQVTAKYTALLQAQRDVLSEQSRWELEILKRKMQTEAEEAFAKLRSELMTKLCRARDAIANNPASAPEELEKMMLTTLAVVEEKESELASTREKGNAIPLSEVESRLEQLTKQVTDLTGENEFLRMTLKDLNGGQDVKESGQEDVIRSMRSAVAEQARKMTEMLKDYDRLKTKLAAYEMQGKAEGRVEIGIEVAPDPPIWRKISGTVWSMSDTSQMYQENGMEPTVILRDLRPPNPRRRNGDNVVDQDNGSRRTCYEVSKSVVFSWRPSSHEDFVVTCSHCKTSIPIDSNIWSVCETVDPCIECRHCHKTVVIPRQMVRGGDDRVLAPEQREAVTKMEKQIQEQVQGLIELKLTMGDNSGSSTSRRAQNASSGVSSRSFTGENDERAFTDAQWKEITEKENAINENIQRLLRLKKQFAKGKNQWEIGGLHAVSISKEKEEKSFKEAFIVQSLASIEISGAAQLEAVENTVRTLTDIDALPSHEAQETAMQIAKTAKSLKYKDAEPEVVESLVKSTKHLLLSLQSNAMDVEPADDRSEIDALIAENQRFRAGITVIREKQRVLSEEFGDIRNLTRELKKKHEEIVAFLTQTLTKVVNSMQKKDGTDKDTINALKEHTEYLTKALIEKESSEKNVEEVDQILRERELEMLGIKQEMMQKNSDVELLTQHCGELASTVEQLQLKLSAAESNLAAVQFNSNQQAAETEALVSELNESKAYANELLAKLDSAELKCHELENKFVIRESDNPIEYSFISPFVVFDTLITDLPPRGVTLIPGVVERPRNQERIRVKVGQSSAKIVLPASRTIGKGKIGLPPTLTTNTARSSYTELVPTRTEDPNTVLYVRKKGEYEGDDLQTASRITHYDHEPVKASVVVQKTIQNFRKRLQMMEIALQDKNHELIETRDRHLKLRTMLTKTTLDQQKAERLVRRSTIERGILKEKLETAYAMIAQRDEEIRELRKLLRDITEGHGHIVMQSMIDKFTKDGSNVVSMREFRHQTLANEIKSTYRISPFLRRLAERQMAAVTRWEMRRNEIQERQRRNLIAVLEGMNLIHEPENVPQDSGSLKVNTPRRTARGTIRITNYGPADGTGDGQPEKYQRKKYVNTRPLFDRALVTFAARKQKLERALRRGVMGQHVKV